MTSLREAVSADLGRFLVGEVEARLRSRPHFTGRTPPQALVQLRRRLDEEPVRLADEAMTKLGDLATWYAGAEPDEAEEAAAVARVLGQVVDRTRSLLLTYGFPGDARPDDPDDETLDLNPGFELDYEPSPAVLWAWRQIRGLDTAERQLAKAPAPPDTFEVRFHLPEALPPDRSRRPTID